jgi:hypothetical protein
MRIDQIVYQDPGRGRLNRLGRDGVGPIAASMDQGRLADWHSILMTHIFADPRYDHASICFLVAGRRSALLYRTTSHRNRSSAFAHVLVGDRDLLSAETALGSWQWRWPGAIGPRALDEGLSPELPPVNPDGLIQEASAEWRRLLAVARETPGLNLLIADMLGKPGQVHLQDRKFAIIASEAERGDLRIRLLAGLLSLLGGGFLDAGFSTHETRYDDSQAGLPRLVFASSAQVTRGFPITRHVVDLCGPDGATTDRATTEHVTLAAQLLTSVYRGSEPAANLARLIAGQDVRGVSAEQAQWLRYCGFIPPLPPARPAEPEPEPEPEAAGAPMRPENAILGQATSDPILAAAQAAEFSVLDLARRVTSADDQGMELIRTEILRRAWHLEARLRPDEAARAYLAQSSLDLEWVGDRPGNGPYQLKEEVVDALVDALFPEWHAGPAGPLDGSAGQQLAASAAVLRDLAAMPGGMAPRQLVRRADQDPSSRPPPPGPEPTPEMVRWGRIAAAVAVILLILIVLLFLGGMS